MVEAGVEGLLGVDRAAEAHAAEDREAAAARERQVDERQEVLVPAHRDAVLGDAAESGQRPLVEGPRELGPVADRADPAAVGARPVGRQRLDLEPVDARDAEALVQEVVRQRVAGRAEADDEDVLAACRGAGCGRRGCSGFQRVSRP